ISIRATDSLKILLPFSSSRSPGLPHVISLSSTRSGGLESTDWPLLTQETKLPCLVRYLWSFPFRLYAIDKVVVRIGMIPYIAVATVAVGGPEDCGNRWSDVTAEAV